MPLHLFLGLGPQALDIVEAEALKLDTMLMEKGGQTVLTDAFLEHATQALELQDLTSPLNQQQAEVEQIKALSASIEAETKQHESRKSKVS